jgi:hypothetical protein
LRIFAWNHSFLFNTLWSFVVAAPPFIVVNYFNNSSFSDEFKREWSSLARWLSADPILWTVAAMLWIPSMEQARRWLAGLLLDVPVSWKDASQVLLAALDNVVSCKDQRFGEAVQRLSPSRRRRSRSVAGGGRGSTPPSPASPSGEEIFKLITRPEAQIERLTTAVFTTFDTLTREQGERQMQTLVSLALVRGDKVEEIPHCLPKSHRLPDDVFARLSSPNSAIMSALRANKMLIIPSTFDEMEKQNGCYVRLGDASDATDGAHICYPIPLAETGVAFVLSIFYPRRDAFQKRHQAAYEELLKRFALRLHLEYSLLLLKGVNP